MLTCIKKTKTLALLSAIALASCVKTVDTSLQVDKDSPVSFYSGIAPARTEQTKGDVPINETTLKTEHFGVFAYWEQEDDYFDGVEYGHLYLDNRELLFSSTEGGTNYWRCSPEAYWPLGCTLTFFGYAPYMSTRGPELVIPASDTEIMPRGQFTQKSDVKKQIDLCLTAPAYDQKKSGGEVALSFTHALSKVLFYFNIANGKYEGDERCFMIKSMKLCDVVGTNSFTYGGIDGYRWDQLPRSDLSTRTKSYSLSLEEGTLSYIPLPYAEDRESESGLAKYECVNGEDDGILYLLPQPMTGISYLEFVLSLYSYDSVNDVWIEDPSGEMDPVKLMLPETTVWDKGRTVCYSASVNAMVPMSFSVTLCDWEGNVIEDVNFSH